MAVFINVVALIAAILIGIAVFTGRPEMGILWIGVAIMTTAAVILIGFGPALGFW